jgi:hypothetical protein
MILDFTYNAGAAGAPSTEQAKFGTTGTFSGGTFSYPGATATYPITSDVTGNNWHMTGTVGDYSGFGLYMDGCKKVDFSAYRGIQFTIGGTSPSTTGAGTLTFGMGTAGDSIAYAWFVNKAAVEPSTLTETPNFGECFPTDPINQYYPANCSDPKYTVTVPATPGTITVLWADLMGGLPEASVTPSEITSIWWSFPWNGAADTPYAVDITVDDIQLVP